MATIQEVTDWLREEAPLELAESWDNVGLLVGDPSRDVRRIMTCLTVTPRTVDEAVDREAGLIISHHPCPFHSLKRLTTDTPIGRMLLRLVQAKVAVYSAHTAFDSAMAGINQRIAEALDLADIGPLQPTEEDSPVGTGRVGLLKTETTLASLARQAKMFFQVNPIQVVGPLEVPVRRIAIACGAAGELLEIAKKRACDAMILGETRLHTCLEAEAESIGLIMPGHYASERFALDRLAESLDSVFPQLEVWASETECDPIAYL